MNETNDMRKTLQDEIGFVTKEQLSDYQRLQEISDKISETARTLDVTMGELTFAYLAIIGDSSRNDLLSESYKAFLKRDKRLLEHIRDEIDKALGEMSA